MSNLSSEQFADFFRALHVHDPYPWQVRLFERAFEGDWPDAIDLPTGSGKTACIDIALFALACHAGRDVNERRAPRRIFFCVNRRVIVDEAYDRAREIERKLCEAERSNDRRHRVLRDVARALRKLAGTTLEDDSPPLDVIELRGGIYRDNRWARSAAQPTVICTTIDQLGSKLLFRGYGVSPNAAPIQAAFVAYDSLVLLDEAHISRPFLQTLERVRDYLDPMKNWAREPIGTQPMIVVPMTATPPDDGEREKVIRLDDEDRKNELLNARLKASKRATLEAIGDVSKAIIEHAETLAAAGTVAVGIIVNRVATAKAIYKHLHARHSVVELVIGAMRPVDRDEQSERLAKLVGKERPPTTDTTSFIVATQCLEVGADYDFDVLLTECASLDALRQRFGRLNRGGREIEARAAVFIKDKDVKPDEELKREDPRDPIYGNALAKTWNWLWSHADVATAPEAQENEKKPGKRGKGKAKPAVESRTIDFGIDAFNRLLHEHAQDKGILSELLAPSASLDAPAMLPVYPDFWCQTSPRPLPDPDVAVFIHGEHRGEPDVQVCWRADLVEDIGTDNWRDVVALLPPTAAECMSVAFSRVRDWLAGKMDGLADAGDTLEVARQAEDDRNSQDRRPSDGPPRRGVLWRGAEKSRLIGSPDDLRPGDTLVLPMACKGWDELGHIPDPVDDRAEKAFELARDKYALRLHPSLFPAEPADTIKTLLGRIADPDDPPNPPNITELRELMDHAAEELANDNPLLKLRLTYFANPKYGFLREVYPDKRGIVLTSRKRLKNSAYPYLPSLDEGEDETSRLGGGKEVSLEDHTNHVCEALERMLKLLHVCIEDSAFLAAADRHDWGKVDERFQAMIRGTDRTDASLFPGDTPEFLAKSADGPNSPRQIGSSGLPSGFRHEMLSVQLAERAGITARDDAERDLILHLIAAHHGRARPFAPVVIDDHPPLVEYQGAELSSDDRRDHPAHRLDSGVADRFWTLTRHFGWWGLAYLEALLRLADQQASANEAGGKYDDQVTGQSAEANV